MSPIQLPPTPTVAGPRAGAGPQAPGVGSAAPAASAAGAGAGEATNEAGKGDADVYVVAVGLGAIESANLLGANLAAAARFNVLQPPDAVGANASLWGTWEAAGCEPDRLPQAMLHELANLGPVPLEPVIASALGDLEALLMQLGQDFVADALAPTLNGLPAGLLTQPMAADVLMRALALTNQPLGLDAFVVMRGDADAAHGLIPGSTYQVLGVSLKNGQPTVLVADPKEVADTPPGARAAIVIELPLAALQRAALMALLATTLHARPFDQEAQAAGGPVSRKQCCLSVGAGGTTALKAPTFRQPPMSLNDPRCALCPIARELCLRPVAGELP